MHVATLIVARLVSSRQLAPTNLVSSRFARRRSLVASHLHRLVASHLRRDPPSHLRRPPQILVTCNVIVRRTTQTMTKYSVQGTLSVAHAINVRSQAHCVSHHANNVFTVPMFYLQIYIHSFTHSRFSLF